MDKSINKSLFGTLVDESYEIWKSTMKELNTSISYTEALSALDGVHSLALQLNKLDGQVLNGGFSQWYRNGYLESDFSTLSRALRKAVVLDVPCLLELKNILSDIQELDSPYDRDPVDYIKEYHDELSLCDNRYSSIYKELETIGFDILLSDWDKIKDR